MIAAAVATLAAVLAASGGATAPRPLLVGITDDAQVIGRPATTFPLLRRLHVKVLRVNLPWNGIAPRRPHDATNPDDPAYNWGIYDRIVRDARRHGIQLLFTIAGSPEWASGFDRPNHAPKQFRDLQDFAYAAASRYPSVHRWMAWNEPNNPVFLRPQYRLVDGRWVMQSAIDYARICGAVFRGVHATGIAGEQVACGGTDPNGNDRPDSTRPSASPLVFLRALKRAGLETFDVYAHHPYPFRPWQSPVVRPGNNSVALGNIDRLLRLLGRLYGPKHLWITEFGYQTSPPDRQDGVPWRRQAAYLKQAFAIARSHPRIDLMVWFLVRDEPRTKGWASGFVTASGRKKPSFAAFRALPR
jgi:hypothetical protein